MAIDILLLEMIKRISYAVILGLIVSRLKLFDRLMVNKLSWFDRIAFTVIFSSIAILGTYGGIPIQDALANSRMIGIMAAGLIGGPYLGTSVGIVSGLHRYSLGGFTALACAISSITEGFLAGLFQKYYKGKLIPWPIALGIGFFSEILQMLIILLVAQPYDQAYALVNSIAVPMTIANSLGLALFMYIIKAGSTNGRSKRRIRVKISCPSPAKRYVISVKVLIRIRPMRLCKLLKSTAPTTRCLLRIRSRFSPISGPKAITMRPA